MAPEPKAFMGSLLQKNLCDWSKRSSVISSVPETLGLIFMHFLLISSLSFLCFSDKSGALLSFLPITSQHVTDGVISVTQLELGVQLEWFSNTIHLINLELHFLLSPHPGRLAAVSCTLFFFINIAIWSCSVYF